MMSNIGLIYAWRHQTMSWTNVKVSFFRLTRTFFQWYFSLNSNIFIQWMHTKRLQNGDYPVHKWTKKLQHVCMISVTLHLKATQTRHTSFITCRENHFSSILTENKIALTDKAKFLYHSDWKLLRPNDVLLDAIMTLLLGSVITRI